MGTFHGRVEVASSCLIGPEAAIGRLSQKVLTSLAITSMGGTAMVIGKLITSPIPVAQRPRTMGQRARVCLSGVQPTTGKVSDVCFCDAGISATGPPPSPGIGQNPAINGYSVTPCTSARPSQP